jgi:hypothetical protein
VLARRGLGRAGFRIFGARRALTLAFIPLEPGF